MKYQPLMRGKVKKERSFGVFELLIILLMLLVLSMYLFQGYVIEGPSMRPTYNSSAAQDEVLVKKYFYRIGRGDIIVFKLSDENDAYIKRVIAVEGDSIMFVPDSANDNYVQLLRRNGDTWSDPVSETYIAEGGMERSKFALTEPDWTLEMGVEITVPKGCYFVMGDNRNHSTDSRRFGFVERREVIGKVSARITGTVWSYLFIKKSSLNNYNKQSSLPYNDTAF